MKLKRKNHRWRLLADVQIQGQICIRVVAYWLLCQATIFATIALFDFLTKSTGGIGSLIVPAMIVSILMLPIALVDMLKFSNKFAGPMVNLRRRLTEFKDTGSTDAIIFRDGDYYTEIADLINELRLMQTKSIPNEELEIHV